MSGFPPPEENLDELQAQVTDLFRKASRRHLPPARGRRAQAPPVRSSARLLAQAQIGTSSGPESSQEKAGETEAEKKETTPPQTALNQQLVVADPTTADGVPKSSAAEPAEPAQPAPLAVTPPPSAPEVIDVDEDSNNTAPSQPSRANKRVREGTAASDQLKRGKVSAPLPSPAAPPQTPFGSSEGILSGFTPRSFTREEIERTMNEVRQPGFHRTYREFIDKVITQFPFSVPRPFSGRLAKLIVSFPCRKP